MPGPQERQLENEAPTPVPPLPPAPVRMEGVLPNPKLKLLEQMREGMGLVVVEG